MLNLPVVRRSSVVMWALLLILFTLFLESLLGDHINGIKPAFVLAYLLPIFLIDWRRQAPDLVEVGLVFLFGIYCTSAFVYGEGYKYSIYLALVFFAYRFSRGLELSFDELRLIAYASLFMGCVVLVLSHIVPVDVPKNTVGSGAFHFFCVSVLMLSLINGKVKTIRIILLLSFLLLLLSDVRAVAAQMLVLLFAFSRFGYLIRRFVTPFLVFGLFLFCLFFVVAFISYSSDFEFFSVAEVYVSQSTGRSINSGRQIIWPMALELIGDKPAFGYGAGFLINSIAGSELWSAHNAYLQVAMQTGLVGAVLLLVVLYLCAKNIYKTHGAQFGIVYLSIWFCIATFNILEVSLFQNTVPISIVQWVIFGMMVNRNFLKFR